mgnify:CR=1 FL=1
MLETMRIYTKNIGHGHHEIEVIGEDEFGDYDPVLARCTTTNVEAIDSMKAMFLGSGGFYETQNDAKEALINEAFEKGCVKTAMKKFNKAVDHKKKAILEGSAESVLFQMDFQHQYRTGGIIDLTFDELLTEIAQKEVLGIDFVDNINLTDAVLDWRGIYDEYYETDR